MNVVRWLFAVVCVSMALPLGTCDRRRPLRVHEVKRGESLIGVARRYGIEGGWETIASYRRPEEPLHLRRGEILLLPDQPSTRGLPFFAPPVTALPEEWPQPCAVMPWSEVTRSEERVCMWKGDETVCQDWSSGEGVFWLEAESRRKVGWNGHTFMENGRFEVVEVDLDGDGANEVVVAALETVSNGMAVSSWRLAILDGATNEPLVVNLQEYGQGTFVQGEIGCDLLRTEWRWLTEQKRGSGLYFVGRRHRYVDGDLLPTGRTLIRRWWDDTLMEDRRSELDGTLWKSRPAAMLSGTQVQIWREEMEPNW